MKKIMELYIHTYSQFLVIISIDRLIDFLALEKHYQTFIV